MRLAIERKDLAGGGEIRSITGAAESDIVASFDGDWGNDRDWGAAGPYDYFSDTRRTRRTFSEDLRYVSAADGAASWVATTNAAAMPKVMKLKKAMGG